MILPGEAGKLELEKLVADLASTPLNHQRPLWDMHLTDTSLGGQALVVRIHHAMGDGFSLVRAMLTMMDNTPEGAPRPPSPEPLDDSDDEDDEDCHQGSRLVRAGLKLTGSLWSKYVEVVTHPTKAVDYLKTGRDVASELCNIATLGDDSPCRLRGKTTSTKRVAWSEQIDLPDIKAVGKVLGCSVNDLLIAATAGAFRHYLQEKGMMPTRSRSAPWCRSICEHRMMRGHLATASGWWPWTPLDVEHPLQRLYTVRDRMQALRTSLQPVVVLNLLHALGMAPNAVQQQAVELLTAKASAVITNVPGPQQTLYLAGAKLRQPLFWVPQSGISASASPSSLTITRCNWA